MAIFASSESQNADVAIRLIKHALLDNSNLSSNALSNDVDK